MLFYILTVILGIVLDFSKKKGSRINTFRKLFVVWLYVFLCFGYMTGSDWRTYEESFSYLNQLSDLGWLNEMGFNLVFLVLKKILRDFWIVLGLLKCFYLYTLIRVVKKITPYWLSAVSLFITGSLSFILIDNPLRFMTALILVNIAIEFCLDNKKGLAYLLAFISFFMHNASIFFVLLIPLMLYADKISRWNRLFITVLYLIVILVSSNVQIVEGMRRIMIALASIFGEVGSYSAYEVTSNAGFFTLGNLASIILFFVVLMTRDNVVQHYENGNFIYGMSIFYCLFSKLFLIIPTGFRLLVPFGIFYMVYMAYLIRTKSILKWIFVVYVSLSFPMNLWNTYKYIPYSNSIPYIVAGHINYDTRYIHNIEAYEKRTGKTYYGNFEE